MTDDLLNVFATIGPRLRALRKKRGVTLGQLADETGISESTLSRLECGSRKPTLELLLPLARRYRMSLDELVDAPPTGDPRVYLRPVHRNGVTRVQLSPKTSDHSAFKQILPADPELLRRRDQYTHPGYEWAYVLAGKLRLALADQDHILVTGQASEIDTRLPHGYANAGDSPLELLVIFRDRDGQIPLRVRTVLKGTTPIPCVPAD